MLRKVLNLSTHPRKLLRSVLALDDSPHAIALGVAIGVFFGLTPTVGLQTILIVGLMLLTRRFFYFNGAAAMAATYLSNPITMVPLYYFWYRLGTYFIPGNASLDQLDDLVQADGLSGCWDAMCTIAVDFGAPMIVGALITAVIGSVAVYPACYMLLNWVRTHPKPDLMDGGTGDSQSAAEDAEEESEQVDEGDAAADDDVVQSRCVVA